MHLYLMVITSDILSWSLGGGVILWSATFILHYLPSYHILKPSHTYGAAAERSQISAAREKLSQSRRTCGMYCRPFDYQNCKEPSGQTRCVLTKTIRPSKATK